MAQPAFALAGAGKSEIAPLDYHKRDRYISGTANCPIKPMIVSRTLIEPEAVARHYDELDEFYRDVWGEHVHHGLWLAGTESAAQATLQLAEQVAASAQVRPGDAVCDVGSGYGATARLLAEQFGAQVTALTVTPRQHAYACSVKPGAVNPRYVLGNWLDNEFAAESFDAVIAIESTEHMSDKGRFFSEAARVLRAGGRLVVCAWLARENPRPWEVRRLLEPICREGRMPGMGTEADYRELLRTAGLVCEQFSDLSSQVSRTWTICIARLLQRLARRPAYLRYLLDRRNGDRVFAATLWRIRAAYATGSMRYGVFTARRAESRPQ